MKNTKIAVCSLIFLFIFTIGCKDKKIEPNLPYVVLDPWVKEYFASYGKGSMWIYEEENTGEIDTMKVTAFIHITKWNVDNKFHPESYRIFYESTKTPSFQANISVIDEKQTYFRTDYRVFSGTSFFINKDSMYPAGHVQLIDSMFIDNRLYTQVIKMHNKSDINYTELYFAKGIGIIKKVARDQIDVHKAKPYILKDWQIKF